MQIIPRILYQKPCFGHNKPCQPLTGISIDSIEEPFFFWLHLSDWRNPRGSQTVIGLALKALVRCLGSFFQCKLTNLKSTFLAARGRFFFIRGFESMFGFSNLYWELQNYPLVEGNDEDQVNDSNETLGCGSSVQLIQPWWEPGRRVFLWRREVKRAQSRFSCLRQELLKMSVLGPFQACASDYKGGLHDLLETRDFWFSYRKLPI